MPFVFRLMPHDPTVGKIIVFSCPDELRQKVSVRFGMSQQNKIKSKDTVCRFSALLIGDTTYMFPTALTNNEDTVTEYCLPMTSKSGVSKLQSTHITHANE